MLEALKASKVRLETLNVCTKAFRAKNANTNKIPSKNFWQNFNIKNTLLCTIYFFSKELEGRANKNV
jgi:hypothetical protein